MNAIMTVADLIRFRTVNNKVILVREHLEAMQRDTHGLEFDPWKREVDALWKTVFDQINRMEIQSQPTALEFIKEAWTSYLTHYCAPEKPL